MHILGVELCSRNHVCMFDSWMEICKENRWKLSTFATEEIDTNISQNVKLFSQSASVASGKFDVFRKFLLIVLKNRPDSVVFFSIQSHFLLHLILLVILRLFGIKIAISIHNANTWFKYPIHKHAHIKSLFKNKRNNLLSEQN